MIIKRSFSIKVTLFAILGVLNLVIAGQAAYNLIGSLLTYNDLQRLNVAMVPMNRLFEAEKFLSQERATSIVMVGAANSAALRDEKMRSRAEADKALADGLSMLSKNSSPEVRESMQRMQTRFTRLKEYRAQLDNVIDSPKKNVGINFEEQFFNTVTDVIMDVHSLIEVYARPYYSINPATTRQLRYSHIIWNITEYAGREYALMGRLISESKSPGIKEQRRLFLWQGRLEYAWELAQNALLYSPWGNRLQPYLDEAQTHYFMTFEQVQAIFNSQAPQTTGKAAYPMSANMWLEIASQAVDSLYSLNDAVLKITQEYMRDLKGDAWRSIMINLFLFLGALFLSFYSWRVITGRVIQPVNSMIDALYRATRGESYVPPNISYGDDEIGRLGGILKLFQENARQLQVERDRAQEANVAKSEFLANMSHEIRTPMNVVLGLSSILSKSKLSEKQAEYIKTLQLSAESLLAIINDLLDFSKIETRSFELEEIPFSLSKLIEEVVRIFDVKAKEKGLTFGADISEIEGKSYIGDPTRMRQVLNNICGNAIKFTVEGSVNVDVKTRSTSASMEEITIRIRDTGIGIPPSKIDLIFDKFTQADSTISRKYGGTGLGLAIAKTFVEMMNGDITVESELGKGTVFTIRLVLSGAAMKEKKSVIQQGSAVVAPPAEDAPTKLQERQRVLLVEDYAPNVVVAGTYLDQFGYDYDVAENGFEAIKKFKERKYFAVLMDVQMHGMDGYQTTREIRKYERSSGGRRTHIIGMTAHALVGDREKCLEAGMDDYLAKPFKGDDLQEKLSFDK